MFFELLAAPQRLVSFTFLNQNKAYAFALNFTISGHRLMVFDTYSQEALIIMPFVFFLIF